MVRRKLIIVDDDRDTREMLTLSLQSEGFDVREAPDGLGLISTLEVERPDAILLDVMMSWINGFELCRAIKSNDDFKDIPVVFVSARQTAADIEQGIAVGAADYFSKPLDMPQLARRLDELISASKAVRLSS